MKYSLLVASLGIASFLVANTASADVAKGEASFKKNCVVCHSNKPGEKKIGPNLSGLAGRDGGTEAGFKYSEGFGAGVKWDAANLQKFLENPKAMYPKTKMTFPGMKDAAERADLLEYLGVK
ncbi:MAG: c-type cytochrome [Magnetococcales bacterium]|nr:c-type cytochrome [Magnetococcales bacterium]